MKRLTCEMCGSTDIIKQDGVFVCQSCGCKYSVEEAKKMMIEGTVDVSGSTIKVDNADKLERLLLLARRARTEDNTTEAKKYYELAMIEDPSNWESSFYSAFYNVMESPIARLPEEIRKFNSRSITTLTFVFENVPASELPDTVHDLIVGVANLYVVLTNHIEKQRKEEREKFSKELIKLVMQQNAEAIKRLNEPYDRSLQESFALTASMRDTITTLWKTAAEHRGEIREETLNNTHDICDQLYVLDSFLIIENKDYRNFTKSLVHFEWLRKADNPDFNSKGVKALQDRARTFNEDSNRALGKELLQLITQYTKEEQDALQAKINAAYWNEHKEEKEEMENRKAGYQEELRPLDSQRVELTRRINDLRKDREHIKVPAMEERRTIQGNIQQLNSEISSLGIFRGKEKKQLRERVEELSKKLQEVDSIVGNQTREAQAQIDAQIAQLNIQLKPIEDRMSTLSSQIKAIDDEFAVKR